MQIYPACLGLVFFACSNDSVKPVPIVSSVEPINITDVSAVSGGIISSDGGESVIARGVVWSINPTPTILDSKTTDGSGAGSFNSEVNGLLPETSYFIRAYATNKNGTGYGVAYSFKTQIKFVSVTNKQLMKLAKSWKITSVTLDGVDQKSLYPNFQLVISGTLGATSYDYSVVGRPALSPWKPVGTWSFGSDITSQIIRDPDIPADRLNMTYVVSDNTLQVQFAYQGAGYTRVDQVKGNWLFVFGL